MGERVRETRRDVNPTRANPSQERKLLVIDTTNSVSGPTRVHLSPGGWAWGLGRVGQSVGCRKALRRDSIPSRSERRRCAREMTSRRERSEHEGQALPARKAWNVGTREAARPSRVRLRESIEAGASE
jgi:hypothetical protein